MSESLLKKVYSLKNLRRAWNLLNKQNKYSHGLSNETIEDFSKNPVANLKFIQKDLKSCQYNFSKLRGVTIPKKGKGGKFRPLRIADVRDRVVLKAIANVIEPVLDSEYNLSNEVSFAYRKGRGVREAIRRMVSFHEKQYHYILKSDIIKFFDTVDRGKLLKDYIFKSLPDLTINELIENGLNQEVGNKEDLTEDQLLCFQTSEGGIPQGSTLSPILSNVYLAPFDKHMTQMNFNLIRYADDFLVMCQTYDEAFKAYETARDYLKTLGLSIDPPDSDPSMKTKILRPSQVPLEFLSVCYNGNEIYPSKENFNLFKERIRDITEWKESGTLLKLLIKTNNLVTGWLAAYSYTHVDKYFAEVDQLINVQLEYSLRKHNWKLRKLGKTKNNKDCLSNDQRKFSGIPFCHEIISKMRKDIPSI
jgi:RNA-directed DNA polymerase